jgi:hypothetical protein
MKRANRTTNFVFVPSYQKDLEVYEKEFRIVVEGNQEAKRREGHRLANLAAKVVKMDMKGRSEHADPPIVNLCEKHPQYIEDLAVEFYLQARDLYARGSKMDTHLMINMAYVILKLPEGSMKNRCAAIYNMM